MEAVRYQTEGRVAIFEINRPEAMNAINGDVNREMTAALDAFEADPGLLVGILTGSGDRAFSAGADLKALAAGQGEALSAGPGGFAGFARYPRTKPVIAAVNGFALAGGMELVLACDLVVASRTAEFGLPEPTRGIVAAAGGLFRLPLRIPRARALELILTGDRLAADEAYRLGLVNRLVEPGQVMDAARELAARITANAPVAVRESFLLARQAHDLSEAEAWRLSELARERVRATADAREGPRAFVEKRRPVWKGE